MSLLTLRAFCDVCSPLLKIVILGGDSCARLTNDLHLLCRMWCIRSTPDLAGPLLATVARSAAAMAHTQKQQLLMECLDLVTVLSIFTYHLCLPDNDTLTREHLTTRAVYELTKLFTRIYCLHATCLKALNLLEKQSLAF